MSRPRPSIARLHCAPASGDAQPSGPRGAIPGERGGRGASSSKRPAQPHCDRELTSLRCVTQTELWAECVRAAVIFTCDAKGNVKRKSETFVFKSLRQQ